MIIPEPDNSMLGSDVAADRMEVKPDEIQKLLEFFSKNTYKAKDTHSKVHGIMDKCIGLFALDYNFSVLPNKNGELSANYPSKLVILDSEKDSVPVSISNTSSSAVTTPSNGISNLFHANQTNDRSYCDHDTNGVTATSSAHVSKTEDINTNGKIFGSAQGCSDNGCVEGGELNSVYIETGDFQTEEKKSKISGNDDIVGASSVPPESTSVTSSTNSDLISSVSDNGVEVPKLKDLCIRARLARCRCRFPIPVILYKQKHICRSATLSGGPEIYGRSSYDYLFAAGVEVTQIPEPTYDDDDVSVPAGDWQLFDRVRSQDIKLLKTFQVQTIVDLMVEKKKVKFGLYVTSSEKVDKENRYSDFTIVSLPYPGCEFFKKYRDNGYNGEGLVFEWHQTHVDAGICVPQDPVTAALNADWSAYRKWDLILLTKNYLKLLLAYTRGSEDGLLIHCISGWDRTPLFISLLRLSLWADGVIHKSLNAEQILYLTLAYDWLLFGHNLQDRLSKGEEILFFCFYFLKFIVTSDYSVEESSNEMPKSQQNTRRRNDSDIQLDGVLLEGSPDGSNWSLNSCSSSGSKTRENPPVFFSVENGSWDDSMGANHVKTRKSKTTQGVHSSFAHNKDETDCSPASKNGSVDLDSFVHDPTSFNPLPQCSSTIRPDSTQHASSTSVACTSGVAVSNGKDSENKQYQGRTSPVAVPRSNMSSHYRHESVSSASIGSWQFITGTGSLRETISTSDPGSSHSHPSRLSLSSAIECIEASESSCTLVDELTPVEFPDRHPLASFDSNYGIPLNESRNGFENELDDSLVHGDEKSSVTVSDRPATLTPPPPGSCCRNRNFMSRRRERLQTVRAHFYTLYAASIGFQFKNDGSGLGSLFGNFATKVGIRSAPRHMS